MSAAQILEKLYRFTISRWKRSTAIYPEWFLADPLVRPFARDRRVDLTAADVQKINDEEFVVYRERTPEGMVEIVRAIVPYAMERTGDGLATESFQMLNPLLANGFFLFSPKLQQNAAEILDVNFNAPQAIAGPPSNNERISRSGIAHISANPWIDASARYNPLFSIEVPSKIDFLVTFALAPNSAVNPIPQLYTIGTPGAPLTKRVDFAGVVVSGVTVPQGRYDELLAQGTGGTDGII